MNPKTNPYLEWLASKNEPRPADDFDRWDQLDELLARLDQEHEAKVRRRPHPVMARVTSNKTH